MLVTVKAYPSISTKYGEAICVAGVRLDTPEPEWIRLFPVSFRDLPRRQQFKKYEVIRVLAKKHTTDKRAETWRPHQDSIERVRPQIKPGGAWLERRRYVEPLIGPSMCELNKGRVGNGAGPSLGLVRPRRVISVLVAEEDDWSLGQRAMAGQGNLLTAKTELEKPGHAFSYSYECEDAGCNGHKQKIVDWELGEAYRSWGQSGYDPVREVKRRWHGTMCDPKRELMFFVGDQHRRPGKFLVLGTFYPEHRSQDDQLSLI
jgi:hypothetical protein